MKAKKMKLALVMILVAASGICGLLSANNVGTAAIQEKSMEQEISAGNELLVQDGRLTSGRPQIADDAPPGIRKILARGKLIVGIYPKDAPFFMTDDKGELYGLDIELAKNIARQLKVEVEFNQQAGSYQDLVDLLQKEEVDVVISKLSRTFDRAKYIRYTRPYIKLRRALLVNRVEAVKHKIEEYPMDYLRQANVRIGVLAKSSYAEFVKEDFKNATVVEYENWDDVVNALVKGEIFAALRDENEIIKLVRQNPDLALYASVYILKDQMDYISMAVPYKSTQLLSWLDTYLETYQVEKDVNTLIKEYPEVYSQNKNK